MAFFEFTLLKYLLRGTNLLNVQSDLRISSHHKIHCRTEPVLCRNQAQTPSSSYYRNYKTKIDLPF